MKEKSHARRILHNIDFFIMMYQAGRDEMASDALDKARRLCRELIEAETTHTHDD